ICLPPATRRWTTTISCCCRSICSVSAAWATTATCSSSSPETPRCCSGWTTTRTMADRKSTRLNSSHSQISYAVFCLKKKTDYCHHPEDHVVVKQNSDIVVDGKWKFHRGFGGTGRAQRPDAPPAKSLYRTLYVVHLVQ